MLKKLILGLPLLGLFFLSCEDKEKKQLQAQNDSLRTELQVSQQTATQLEEVGVLLDSLDASRQLLRTDVVEGTSYKDYKNRLVGINNHIKETQAKINDLEKKVKNNNALQASLKRLRADLEQSSQQIAALQNEIEVVRTENRSLSRNVSQRDSILTVNAETIKMREQDLASLEERVTKINADAQATQADMYFAQAQALETAADRTKFAPRKKKETQREALELYKLSLSLGKTEAQTKVEELEKEVS